MRPFKAMILAAGMGTRLRPLTRKKPKVLVPIQNRPLLLWLIEYLRAAGAEAVIINAHHLSDVLLAYVSGTNFGIPVQVRVENTLLDTGGGIGNVADFWDDRSFLVINGDVFTAIDLQDVLETHERTDAWATLVLTDEPRFNCVQINRAGGVLSFNAGVGTNLAFTGIQVLSPQMLTDIPKNAAISIIDCYRGAIARGERIWSHVVMEDFWRELGNVDSYIRIHHEFFHMRRAPIPGLQVGGERMVHSSSELGPGVRLEGMVCVGAGCVVGESAVIRDSILWEQVQVKAGCRIQDCIIGDGVVVEESVDGTVMV